MQSGFLSRSVDRLVANARVIRGAPEAILLMVIVGTGIGGFGFQHYRERFADLNAQLASRDRLPTEYRTKLTEAETQVVKLTSVLAATEKRLTAANDRSISVENRSRDPHTLYEDNNPIAQVQDPKIDLDQKKVTFAVVNSGYILQTSKLYQFHDWARLYNMVSDGASPEFSYSPLICKLWEVGDRRQYSRDATDLRLGRPRTEEDSHKVLACMPDRALGSGRASSTESFLIPSGWFTRAAPIAAP